MKDTNDKFIKKKRNRATEEEHKNADKDYMDQNGQLMLSKKVSDFFKENIQVLGKSQIKFQLADIFNDGYIRSIDIQILSNILKKDYTNITTFIFQGDISQAQIS